MCIRPHCTSSSTVYDSRKAWAAHDTACIRGLRDEAGGASATDKCPFCLKEFGGDTGRFYSHVGHHMEDVRLFALPPALREYEVGEYDDVSGSGSSGRGGSVQGKMSPLGVYVAENSAIDVVGTRKWAMEVQGEIDSGCFLVAALRSYADCRLVGNR